MTRIYTLGCGILLAALLLAGCNPNAQTTATTSVPLIVGTSVATDAASPAAGGPTTETEATASEATASSTETATTPAATATPTPTLNMQQERIVINANNELEPAVITATTNITLELTLVNQSTNDAVLLIDMAPSGVIGVPLPVSTLTNTQQLTDTTGLTPTATAPTDTVGATSVATTSATSASGSSLAPTEPILLAPTFSATDVPTRTTTAPTTASTAGPTEAPTTISTPTMTPTITPTTDIAGTKVWLEFNRPGTYRVRCAPAQPGEAPACTGTVEINVAAPVVDVTPLVTPTLEATAELTGTTTLTGTATLDETSAATSVSTSAATTEATSSADTAEPNATSTGSANETARP